MNHPYWYLGRTFALAMGLAFSLSHAAWAMTEPPGVDPFNLTALGWVAVSGLFGGMLYASLMYPPDEGAHR